jgi:PAS domain S-box-containing protein
MMGNNDEERMQSAPAGAFAAEGSLPTSEEQLRLLLESVQDYAIFTLDLAGCVTSWNEGARRLTGYTTDEIIGQSLHRFYLPEDLAAGKPEREMQKALTTGRSEDESWRVRKDGSHFWANEIITPLRAEDGTQIGFAKVSRDLSERRQALEALRISEERLRLIIESINDYAIFTQDESGRIVEWNSGAEQVFGHTADEVIGQPSAIVFTPEDRANGVPAHEIQQARTTGRAADERWHLRKDGTRFFASGVLTPLQEGAHSGYVKVARDLTERREMEVRLEEQVKERTVQVRDLVTQLTMSEQEERRRVSSILHDDLQQRLFSLMFQLASLRHALNGSQLETAQQVVTEIEEGLRRSVQITRELSVDLSPPVLHDEGLGAAIRWLATQMDQQQGLAVDVQAGKILPLLNEDLRVLLFQIVRELLFNVVKHAGVNTARVEISKTGDQLSINVSDQGRGFALDSGDGSNQTSQGLARIGQRMQLLGGRMEVASAPGKGTRVTLYVPVQQREGKQA